MDKDIREEKEQIDKIEWIGMDGLIILAFFALVALIFCSFRFHIDILTCWIFPMALLGIVLTVTISYARTLGGFIKMQNEKIKEGNKK